MTDGSSTPAPYAVLARKYRPQSFDDLIGHEAMVRTLRNAFAADRIAHAYVLTGVRGVGKTTTARILARALNYVRPDGDERGEDDGPQIDMPAEGPHCRAIAESRHPDVLEMDAASRTGVNDVRELIDGVRYAPVEARYKVYIIDEVHMLSTQAFNALLKTLEEPPPHVKFIFATTEIRKLPVTVLSRCQRFDLRRIAPDVLARHLGAVAQKEGAKLDGEGLAMIARAAEGSVRDGLSILDQALVQHGAGDEDVIGAETIRTMLGLADRGQVWDLLGACLAGEAKTALERFRHQYDGGGEPVVVMRDLLDLTHLLTRTKAAGASAAAHGPAGEADAVRAGAMADSVEMNVLTRAWSLLMKGLAETQTAPDAAAAAEMALIRLCFASDLPTPDEALRVLKGGGAPGAQPSAPSNVGASPAPSAIARQAPASASHQSGLSAALQTVDAARLPAAKAATETGLHFATFEDVARRAGQERDAMLRAELESYVHIISFEPGRIEMRLDARAPSDLPGRLTRSLQQWTGSPWLVTLNSVEDGAPSLRDARTAEVMAHAHVKSAIALFPNATISAIRDLAPAVGEDAVDPGACDDEIDP